MNPQEALTRRQLFERVFERVSQTAVFVTVAAACSPSTSSPSTSAEGRKDAIPSPSSVEQQIKSIGLRGWRDILSQNQNTNVSAPGFVPSIVEFRTTILNSDVWNDNVFAQLAAGKKIDAPLKMQWVGLNTKNDPQNGWYVQRWTGDVEFTDISAAIGGPAPQTTTWAGAIELKFKERGRSLMEVGTKWMTQSEFQKWASSNPPSLPDFSQPRSGNFAFLVNIASGNLRIDPPYFAYSGATDLALMLKRFHLTTSFLSEGTKPENNCKTVYLR